MTTRRRDALSDESECASHAATNRGTSHASPRVALDRHASSIKPLASRSKWWYVT